MTGERGEGARLIRFCIIGGLNTLCSYLLFAVGLHLGLPYPWATLLAGIAGVALGFKLHGRYVFQNPGRGRFGWFVLVFTATFLASVSVQAAARGFCNGYWAGAFATAVTVPLSFLLNRRLVFRSKPAK